MIIAFELCCTVSSNIFQSVNPWGQYWVPLLFLLLTMSTNRSGLEQNNRTCSVKLSSKSVPLRGLWVVGYAKWWRPWVSWRIETNKPRCHDDRLCHKWINTYRVISTLHTGFVPASSPTLYCEYCIKLDFECFMFVRRLPRDCSTETLELKQSIDSQQ